MDFEVLNDKPEKIKKEKKPKRRRAHGTRGGGNSPPPKKKQLSQPSYIGTSNQTQLDQSSSEQSQQSSYGEWSGEQLPQLPHVHWEMPEVHLPQVHWPQQMPQIPDVNWPQFPQWQFPQVQWPFSEIQMPQIPDQWPFSEIQMPQFQPEVHWNHLSESFKNIIKNEKKIKVILIICY